MTTINKTQKKEPKISIGIVMPEDKQSDLSIKINGNSFDIKIDQEKVRTANNDLSIKHISNEILVNDIVCKDLEIKNRSRNISNYLYLSPINAGRGFHWQKSISIQVLGDIRIFSHKSSLLAINTLYIEDYLMCVATSEMSSECPKALLESQTIAARSWILAGTEKKHKDLELDACNDDCCQRYQGISNLNKKAINASRGTKGRVLLSNNELCDTRYSKSCGGITESNENVWQEKAKIYLRSIADDASSVSIDNSKNDIFNKWIKQKSSSYCSPKYIPENRLEKYLGNIDNKGNYHRWEISYTMSELIKLVNKKTTKKFSTIKKLTPKIRGRSGRIVVLHIEGVLENNKPYCLEIKSEYEIRRIMHSEFLFSSAFTIESNSDEKNHKNIFTLKGSGWGHGVGLCQIGALGMALDGKKTEEILLHYYKNSEIKNIYE